MNADATTPALSTRLLDQLVRVLGRESVITDPEQLLVYESDGLTRFRRRPLAVLLPSDTEGCARAVELMHAVGIPVVPRGAGTGLSGGAVPAAGTVVVGTARMNRILSIDPATRRARVQAGVVNADLVSAARPHGLTYAPDPSSQSACTLGGNVAENAGGPHCLKYGVTSRYVTALTVVEAHGRVLDLDVSDVQIGALDLTGAFVGSEGCFGLATEIEVGLLPLPEDARTLLAAFARPETAAEAVTAVLADGLLPAALEIVDQATVEAVEASIYAAGYPTDAGAVLIVEFDGPTAGLDHDLGRAAELCRDAGAFEVRTASTAEGRAALWAGRKKAFGAMGRLAPDLLVQDATVPRSRLPGVLEAVGHIALRHDLRVANVFHAGDGNLHPNLLFDRRDPEQVERVERASTEIMRACVDAGGTITGEHGVGLDKRAYMRLVHGTGELQIMDRVRHAFDPDRLFNPGKVLPDLEFDDRASPLRRGAAPPDPRVVLEREGIAFRNGPGDEPVIEPRDTDEVCRAVEAAGRQGLQMRWLEGTDRTRRNETDHRTSVLLSTARMTTVDLHDAADFTVTVGSGVQLGHLAAHLEPVRQWLAVDGRGAADRTLGGLAAVGDARALAASFGALRDQVLGLTLVSGEGRALQLGGSTMKNVAGFDLVRLLCGSRGRLGVITRLVLRTWPHPGVERFLSLDASTPEELVSAVGGVLRAPVLPASVELGGSRDHAELLIRVLGRSPQVDHACEVLGSLLGPAGRVWTAEQGAERQRHLRRSVEEPADVRMGPPSAAGLEALLADASGRGRPFWVLPDQGTMWVSAGGSGRPGVRIATDLERRVARAFDPAGTFSGAVETTQEAV